MKKKSFLIAGLACSCVLLQSCHWIDFVPQAEVNVKGCITDIAGNRIDSATVAAIDLRQDENNTYLGSMANDWDEESVAYTTSQKGYYRMQFLSDQRHFTISAVKRERSNEKMIIYSGGKRTEYQKGTTNYTVDFKVKTQIIYYTAEECNKGVALSKYSIHDRDTVHVKLLDGGTIQMVGAGIDFVYDYQDDGIYEHKHSGYWGHYDSVNGGYNAIPDTLTEFDLPIHVDGFNYDPETIHPCIYVESVLPNETHDTREYVIPIELLDHQ